MDSRVQAKTFTRWCNTFLLERDLKIEVLEKELSDGVNLFNLLEILSGETIKPKVNKKAKMKLQKIENLNFSFKFLREKKIKLVNISSEGIETNTQQQQKPKLEQILFIHFEKYSYVFEIIYPINQMF